MKISNTLIPYVIEKTSEGERSYDIYSRLLKDRIVIINGEVEQGGMMAAAASLLFLDKESPTKPIYLYIHSPGGGCYDGMVLINTMKTISAPVYTINMGLAASMGAAIFSCGNPGHRYVMPHSRVMCHQASSGVQGNVQDMEVSMEENLKLNNELAQLIAENTGKTMEAYKKFTERDLWLDPLQAIKFGIADGIFYGPGVIKTAEDLKDELSKTKVRGLK